MAVDTPDAGLDGPRDPPPADPGEAAVAVPLNAATLEAARAVQQHYADRLAALRSDDPPPAE